MCHIYIKSGATCMKEMLGRTKKEMFISASYPGG